MKKISPILIFLLISYSASAQKIEINFWFSSVLNAKQFIEERVAEYNSIQSLVKVKAVWQGLYQEMEIKMLAAAVTGQLPDLAQEKFEYLDLYIEEGLIEPIDDLINEYDKNDVLPVMWESVSRSGRIYGVPFAINTSIFFYNVDIIKNAGLNPEKLPETWEELIEISKKLTVDKNGDGKIDIYGLAMWQNGINSFMPFLWSYGGRLFSEDGKRVVLTSEEMIKTVYMIKDLVHKYRIIPPNWTDFEEAQAFLSGKLAMGPFISGG